MTPPVLLPALRWLWCRAFHPRSNWVRAGYRIRRVSAVFYYECPKCECEHVHVELFR